MFKKNKQIGLDGFGIGLCIFWFIQVWVVEPDSIDTPNKVESKRYSWIKCYTTILYYYTVHIYHKKASQAIRLHIWGEYIKYIMITWVLAFCSKWIIWVSLRRISFVLCCLNVRWGQDSCFWVWNLEFVFCFHHFNAFLKIAIDLWRANQLHLYCGIWAM